MTGKRGKGVGIGKEFDRFGGDYFNMGAKWRDGVQGEGYRQEVIGRSEDKAAGGGRSTLTP
jgi:hypothetical protein